MFCHACGAAACCRALSSMRCIGSSAQQCRQLCLTACIQIGKHTSCTGAVTTLQVRVHAVWRRRSWLGSRMGVHVDSRPNRRLCSVKPRLVTSLNLSMRLCTCLLLTCLQSLHNAGALRVPVGPRLPAGLQGARRRAGWQVPHPVALTPRCWRERRELQGACSTAHSLCCFVLIRGFSEKADWRRAEAGLQRQQQR